MNNIYLHVLICKNTLAHKKNNESTFNNEISGAWDGMKEDFPREKLRKAAAGDGIKAVVLKNDICIDIPHKICDACFLSDQVALFWNQHIITLIPKGNNNDLLIHGNYRGITFTLKLIFIPCKIYCNILNG